jgi:hypothetical protein
VGRGSIRRLCALVAAAAALLAATGSRDGTNVDAAEETNEPNHAGSTGGRSVWYRWVAPYSGTATFDTVGSGFDTAVAVYRGSSVATPALVAENDDQEYDYSATAASYFNYFGAPARAPGKGCYSYELGGWHIVVLNSNCTEVGCSCGFTAAQLRSS